MHPSCSNAADVSSAERPGKRFVAGLIILMAALGFAIYSNVLQRGIFLFDDFEYVVGNPIVQDPSLAARMTDVRQIGYLSFALNNAMDSSDDPRWYHLVNVCIHLLNAMVVFFLLDRICRRLFLSSSGAMQTLGGYDRLRWTLIPALAALVFLSHPLQTQAVSYVTQRFTSLNAFFYVSAVLGYLTARMRFEEYGERTGNYGLLLLSFFLSVLAMKTKETAFTIPVTLAVLELILFRDSVYGKRRFYFVIPFIATLILVPLSLFGPEWGLMERGAGVDEVTRREKLFDLFQRSPLEYLFTQFRVIVIYLRLMAFPVNQLAVYDLRASQTLLEPGVIFSLFLLLSLAGLALYCWVRARTAGPKGAVDLRIVSLGIVWFFVTLSVESSFIPIKDLIFEHRAYLPSVGIYFAASVLLFAVAERIAPRVGHVLRGVVLAAVIVTPLAVATYARNEIWTNEVLFWSDIIQKTGKAIGYNNRGTAYLKEGRYALAIEDLSKTIGFFPDANNILKWEHSDYTPTNMAKTYLSRSTAYEALGDTKKAAADMEMAQRYMMRRGAP